MWFGVIIAYIACCIAIICIFIIIFIVILNAIAIICMATTRIAT